MNVNPERMLTHAFEFDLDKDSKLDKDEMQKFIADFIQRHGARGPGVRMDLVDLCGCGPGGPGPGAGPVDQIEAVRRARGRDPNGHDVRTNRESKGS